MTTTFFIEKKEIIDHGVHRGVHDASKRSDIGKCRLYVFAAKVIGKRRKSYATISSLR